MVVPAGADVGGTAAGCSTVRAAAVGVGVVAVGRPEDTGAINAVNAPPAVAGVPAAEATAPGDTDPAAAPAAATGGATTGAVGEVVAPARNGPPTVSAPRSGSQSPG